MEEAKVTKWRCTHGHKWEAEDEQSYTVRLYGDEIRYCRRCYFEWVREHLGRVKEDK